MYARMWLEHGVEQNHKAAIFNVAMHFPSRCHSEIKIHTGRFSNSSFKNHEGNTTRAKYLLFYGYRVHMG